MNKEYKIKLDLNKKLYNKKMAFNQFDENVNDFYIEVTKNNELVKDLDKSIITLVAIKPNGEVDAQFIEVKEGQIYADLKPSMCDLVGNYQAKAMIVLEGKIVTTDTINYSVNEDKIISKLNEDVVSDERFTLFTDALARLSAVEISEDQRMINEAERKLAEEERNANYNFMTEDEERRRSEANAHKEAENLRVQAETNRVNEEAKRRTTEQGRVSAENTRVSNENTREANEVARQSNETKRVEAETQRQNRYNSFIAEAEANANEFENYTNTAKVKEEERKANELDRKSQEDRRVSNENERVSSENTRKANEETREENETSRQNVFENKVNEVDEKIVELNTTKDNFVSSINTKVDNKISEIDSAKTDMSNTVSNKVNEVENRFNALTSSQQQDAEVIDARDNETSLKARLDRDIEKANKELDKIKKLEESTVSTVETESDFTTVEATSNGYFEDVKLEGKTWVNLWDVNKLGKSGQTVIKNNRVTAITTTNVYSNFFYDHKTKFKPSTEYTFIVDVYKNTLQSGDSVFITSYSGSNSVGRDIFAINGNTTFAIKGGTVGRIIKKCTTISNFDEVTYATRSFISNSSQTEGAELELSIIILEGDHTQNPPSYFEGLKSVGQSATASEDGADEIVVSSVKGDGNLLFFKNDVSYTSNGVTFTFDSKTQVITVNGTCTTNNTTVTVADALPRQLYNGLYSCTVEKLTDFSSPITIRTYNKAYTRGVVLNTQNSLSATSNIPYVDDEIVFSLRADAGATFNNAKLKVSFYKGGEFKPYTPHQSDKKRLLYYNNETQAWEKPILREWDSIEKHADGKYYYHQRSGEVVLNGSESWYSVGNYIQTTYANSNRLFLNKSCIAICDNFEVKYSGEGIYLRPILQNEVDYIRIENALDKWTIESFKQWLQANNVTVVYQLAQEKVYECTNIDLITYANETNYIVESGAIAPKSILKVHNNISNVVSLLQKKVSLLENNITSYMITQNRLMLASRYNADTVSFKVDVATLRNSFEYDNDLYELILNNILVGKDNYNRDYIENLIIFYWMDFVISDEMYLTLFEIIEEQHNPKVIEEAPIE